MQHDMALANQLGLSSKCVSERHYKASYEKMTAGEAAKYITKRVGRKVLAKDVKALYMTHYGREPEWHHSGFYRGVSGKTMGRTFFLSDEEAQTLCDNYDAIVQKHADEQMRQEQEEVRKRENRVCGFYWTWDYDYRGNYGKKRTFKVLHVYEGNELDAPSRNFTPCTEEQLAAVRPHVDKQYFGWDEPSINDFIKEENGN